VPLDSLLNIEHGKEDPSLEVLVCREGWIDQLVQLYELDAVSGARLKRARDRLGDEPNSAKAWRRSGPY
jgi:hypothetical protein